MRIARSENEAWAGDSRTHNQIAPGGIARDAATHGTPFATERPPTPGTGHFGGLGTMSVFREPEPQAPSIYS